MAGAKVEYLFYLLQVKNKKNKADYKSLTFVVIKAPFLQDVYFEDFHNCELLTGKFVFLSNFED
jgi:hypothetical protein